MNRKVKFRAWDIVNKKILYPKDIFNSRDLWYTDLPDGILQLERILDSYGIRQVLEIQQFTGLFDKNNKEIYENDLIKVIGYDGWDDSEGFDIIGLVKWCAIHIGWRMFTKKMIESSNCSGSDIFKPITIIGNLNENPELLK